NKSPDDPYFEEMNEWMWMWMYQSWLQDQEDEFKKLKDFSTFVGSFSNPEMAQNIIKRDNPDHIATEQDDETSIENLKKIDELIESTTKPRRRRRVINKNG